METGSIVGTESGVKAMRTIAEMQEKYYEITELYDLAEELVETVESEYVQNPELQYGLVEPLAEELGEAADVLSEEFIALAEQKGKVRNKGRIETALRKVYSAIDNYNKQVAAMMGEGATGFRNVADPIVKKIQRQMEVVIAAFVEFVQLSLDRIMHKTQIEELKQRQEIIAAMLHRATMAQGQAT